MPPRLIVEAAVPAALEHGSFFFADIEHNQIDAAARSVLHHLAVLAALSVVAKLKRHIRGAAHYRNNGLA